jgi:HTH-type transcriptional repressor of NAD biosynthesis genes
MIVDDLYENLLRQKINVMDAAKHSNRVLFVDTDALTTAFYADFLLENDDEYVKCRNLANAIDKICDWDLILFLEPTVDFIQDGTRSEEIALNREKYSRMIKMLFSQKEFHCIGGDYLDRFTKAKELIKEHLNIDTEW